MADDLIVVDDYLEKWDRFAQGENNLVSDIRDHKDAFEAALCIILNAKDRRAPARLVFYAVVQVGGFVALDSELGKASATLLGPDFPLFTSKEGARAYFAGELYFWWIDNRKKYESYPLFDEWSQRDFAKRVAVPMYKEACKRK
jgi:hypothetical protein